VFSAHSAVHGAKPRSVTPQLIAVWSPDLDQTLFRALQPILAPVYVEVSPASLPGVETFMLELANHAWWSNQGGSTCASKPMLLSLRTVIMEPLDLGALRLFLAAEVRHRGPYHSWAEFVFKVSDLMRWDSLMVPMNEPTH
jgi:hypothetical protein